MELELINLELELINSSLARSSVSPLGEQVAAPFLRFPGCINKQPLMIAHKLALRRN